MIKKPAVHKRWLFLVLGLLWSGVGVLLNSFAVRWLTQFKHSGVALCVVFGLISGIIITRFGFQKVIKKNIQRINLLTENVCIFAFQAWESYILVAIMMSMGIFMRTTDFIPRLYLSSLYIGIGIALLISSIIYYYHYFQNAN